MNNNAIKSMRRKVESISSLPTTPDVFKRISGIIEKPDISLDKISNFISSDPSLTTKILKMVNSVVYGFPCRISSISHATVLLGLNVIKGLLVGASVFELMQKSILGLWEHSLNCAITAKLIAQRKGLKKPEDVYAAGLLHDIGKVVLILQFPEEYEKMINETDMKGITIFEVEKNHFAETHAGVGSWLAEKWHFPLNLVESIKYHHEPHLSKNAPLETAIVHLSDILVRAMGFGCVGNSFIPVLNPAAFEYIDLKESDIKEILVEMEDSRSVTEELSL
ncbi:MAG: HDOD domain-containing protein [Deltaproteobacteria bacterium]|nr:HDOD domain-containing protein [Deltaproteobacteria bacterium]MBW2660454.1 HDOD domain-containing protein [Deltaproteobacteria bacterium]